MTRLYECDNCGEHVTSVRKTLQPSAAGGEFCPPPGGGDLFSKPMRRAMSKSHSTPKKYHICGDCWDSLDWDGDSE